VKASVLSLALLLCNAPRLPAQRPVMPPQELHDRITAVLVRCAGHPVPSGDTSVVWSPIPNLYVTVRRSPDTLASSLVRADSMVGTAVASWSGGRQSSIRLRWTKADSILLELDFRADSAGLTVTGSRNLHLSTPDLPWAVADYGMEDQLLPLYENLVSRTSVAIYRPFPSKWDTVEVVARRTDQAIVISEVERGGEEYRWVVTLDGALVRQVRSRYPKWERRPLELSSRWTDYLRLSALAGSF